MREPHVYPESRVALGTRSIAPFQQECNACNEGYDAPDKRRVDCEPTCFLEKKNDTCNQKERSGDTAVESPVPEPVRSAADRYREANRRSRGCVEWMPVDPG